MKDVLHPFFGIIITIGFYFLARKLKSKWNVFFLNPVFISVAGIIT